MDSFAWAALGTYDLRALELSKATALEAIKSEFEGKILSLNSEETLVRRCEFCSVLGTVPEDYEERLVELGGGRSVVCGIRHLGMNLAKPFVSVWPNFAVADVEEIRELYRRELAERFEVFKPRWVQISTPTGEESEAAGSVYVATRARTMLRRQKWPGEDDLELVLPSSGAYFAWYQECYDKFHEEFPEKRDWVTSNDRGLMEDCRNAGMLRLVKIGGETAGLIAAEEDDFLGHEGMYFVELLLAKRWRGKGLAKALQRRFVAEVCRPEAVVWGAIDRYNDPSLRTSLANGRRVVRGECFLEVS
ncbi:hypothetical protein VDG1235_3881 [Verrucomicrobiia bacterium DG1235]|nr:hypothetical protein VDG1235_3881 [Verrucomicrobiae bacterium DG1235]